MEPKSNVIAHFIPGILLGTVIGLAIGSLFVASQIPHSAKQIAELPEPPKCAGTFKDLSWKLSGEHAFDIFLKDKKVSTVNFPDGLFNAGDFYQVNSTSEYAYLDFTPDGLGGYILYAPTFDMIRVNTCTGKVDRLVDSTFGQGGVRVALDISPDEKWIVGLFQDINTGPALTITSTDDTNVVKKYAMPDDNYTQFDAKFSPDGTKIAVVGALGNPMSERGALWIFDMNTRTFTGYKGTKPIKTAFGEVWVLNGWTDNETVDVESNMIN
jgi:hypothetical protein